MGKSHMSQNTQNQSGASVVFIPETAALYNTFMQTQEWRQQSKCEINMNPRCNTEEQRMWLLFEEDRIKKRDECSAEYFVQ